jgi:hypothetical protein
MLKGCLCHRGAGRHRCQRHPQPVEMQPCVAAPHGAYPGFDAAMRGQGCSPVVLKNEHDAIRPANAFPRGTGVGRHGPGACALRHGLAGHICGISAGFVAPSTCWVASLTVARKHQVYEREHTWSPKGKHDRVPRKARARRMAGTVHGHLVPRMRFCVRWDALLKSAQPHGRECHRHSLQMDLPRAAQWLHSTRLDAEVWRGG